MVPPPITFETVWRRMPKLPQAEGADFDFSDNPSHDEYTFSQGTLYQRKTKAGMRWLLLLASGVSVSIMYFCMDYIVDQIQDLRMDALEENMASGDYGNAWITHIGIMACLLIPATFIVLVEPQAGGSGIPEIIAYLNGIVAPRSFDGFVVIVKIIGTVLAVASGLAIGPEGPTIHLGAAVTLNMVWVAQSLFGEKFTPLNNDHDKRLFMAAGAAAGIACAFRAPIGGVIFALEEAISHFDANLIVRTYFVCVIAYFTLMILYEGDNLNTDRFTEYQLSIGCNIGYNALDIFLFAILGIFGGLLGGLFNYANMKLNYWRKAHISHLGYRRFAEVMVIMLITSLCVVFVPTGFGCSSPNNLVNHVFPTVDSCVQAFANTSAAAIPDGYCLSDPVLNFCSGTYPTVDAQDKHLEELYDRKFLRNALCSDKTQYNQLESLLQGSGHKTVALLFEEGSNDVFGYGALFVFLIVYFFLALIAAGSSVPAGLVIPMLTIGGTMGRLWALVVNDTFRKVSGGTPVDPGAWAQVGAAAFWCGSGRITVTIAVIVLEITGEYSYLPAIGIAVQFSKWMGDYLNQGLYHQLIHLKAMDLLEYVPRGATKGAFVRDIMTKDVKTVPLEGRCGDLRNMLQSCTHNGFPVVEQVGGLTKLRGLVLRKYLAPRVTSAIDDNQKIDMTVLMTRTPYTCEVDMLAFQSLNMFRLLGIRHLVVLDNDHAVCGILTRKDFHALQDWDNHDPHGHDNEHGAGTAENGAYNHTESLSSRMVDSNSHA
eukprot:m.163767 g.163767  ORF g.163767 m.163767 type:complete len:767 (-) comp12336_c0_seq1:155-2455(-)